MIERQGALLVHKLYPTVHLSGPVNDEQTQKKLAGEEVATKPKDKLNDWFRVLQQTHISHSPDSIPFSRLKDYYYKKYIIKLEDIPETFFENQQRIARERGHGVLQVGDNVRQQAAEMIITDQKVSLDNWLDYFGSNESVDYPMWYKYLAFNAIVELGTYDVDKAKFNKRSSDTVAPYPELNPEAVSLVYDLLAKALEVDSLPLNKGDKQKKLLEELPPLVGHDKLRTGLNDRNFGRLYAIIISQLAAQKHEEGISEEGVWVKYPKNSDHKLLVAAINGKGTGWCTAGEERAKLQLSAGDFYLYSTNDSEGNPTIPRVAIRMEGNEIAEVRGVAPEQNIDSGVVSVAEEKLKEFPDGELYKKRVDDMQTLTALEKKVDLGEDLSLEELKFLFEVESEILGFGQKRDPRIEEVKARLMPIAISSNLNSLLSCKLSDDDRNKIINQICNQYKGQKGIDLSHELIDFFRNLSEHGESFFDITVKNFENELTKKFLNSRHVYPKTKITFIRKLPLLPASTAIENLLKDPELDDKVRLALAEKVDSSEISNAKNSLLDGDLQDEGYKTAWNKIIGSTCDRYRYGPKCELTSELIDFLESYTAWEQGDTAIIVTPRSMDDELTQRFLSSSHIHPSAKIKFVKSLNAYPASESVRVSIQNLKIEDSVRLAIAEKVDASEISNAKNSLLDGDLQDEGYKAAWNKIIGSTCDRYRYGPKCELSSELIDFLESYNAWEQGDVAFIITPRSMDDELTPRFLSSSRIHPSAKIKFVKSLNAYPASGAVRVLIQNPKIEDYVRLAIAEKVDASEISNEKNSLLNGDTRDEGYKAAWNKIIGSTCDRYRYGPKCELSSELIDFLESYNAWEQGDTAFIITPRSMDDELTQRFLSSSSIHPSAKIKFVKSLNVYPASGAVRVLIQNPKIEDYVRLAIAEKVDASEISNEKNSLLNGDTRDEGYKAARSKIIDHTCAHYQHRSIDLNHELIGFFRNLNEHGESFFKINVRDFEDALTQEFLKNPNVYPRTKQVYLAKLNVYPASEIVGSLLRDANIDPETRVAIADKVDPSEISNNKNRLLEFVDPELIIFENSRLELEESQFDEVVPQLVLAEGFAEKEKEDDGFKRAKSRIINNTYNHYRESRAEIRNSNTLAKFFEYLNDRGRLAFNICTDQA